MTTRIFLVSCCLALGLAGCAWVEQANEEMIAIGTGDLGLIAPGLRRPISYPDAEAHCAKLGKEAVLFDLREKNAIWHCTAPK